MKEVNETLSVFAERIERLSQQFKGKEIIFSDEIEKEFLLDADNEDTEKEPVLWPLYDRNMFYIVRTRPQSKIPSHSHEEAVFRILLSGSLRINGRTVDKPGIWFVVRENVKYEIETEQGYVTLAGYSEACGSQRGTSRVHILKESALAAALDAQKRSVAGAS
jgi:hypothetical protein